MGVALATYNSDWFLNGNLSTSAENAPAAINTRHDNNFCQWLTNVRMSGKNAKHNIAKTGTDSSDGGFAGGERCTCDTSNHIWELEA